jgi:probable rRNA maturation factor
MSGADDGSPERTVALVDGDGPRIHAADEQDETTVDLGRWAALARAALVHEGVVRPEAELNLTFVDRATMAGLNEEHLGHEGPTDVLSFPLELPDDVPDGLPVLLGDVVVCPAVAAAQAAEHAGPTHDGTAEDELALLVVHGILHVLGWDHAEPDDEAAMQAHEQVLLGRHHRGDGA